MARNKMNKEGLLSPSDELIQDENTLDESKLDESNEDFIDRSIVLAHDSFKTTTIPVFYDKDTDEYKPSSIDLIEGKVVLDMDKNMNLIRYLTKEGFKDITPAKIGKPIIIKRILEWTFQAPNTDDRIKQNGTIGILLDGENIQISYAENKLTIKEERIARYFESIGMKPLHVKYED